MRRWLVMLVALLGLLGGEVAKADLGTGSCSWANPNVCTGTGGGGGASNLGSLNGGNAPAGQVYNYSAAAVQGITLPVAGSPITLANVAGKNGDLVYDSTSSVSGCGYFRAIASGSPATWAYQTCNQSGTGTPVGNAACYGVGDTYTQTSAIGPSFITFTCDVAGASNVAVWTQKANSVDVRVDDFGCLTSDATACWQAAINAANGAPGGTCGSIKARPDKTYIIKHTLYVNECQSGKYDLNGSTLQWQGTDGNTKAFTGLTNASSVNVTGFTSTGGITVGAAVTGNANLQANTTVASIVSNTAITLSLATTGSVSNLSIFFPAPMWLFTDTQQARLTNGNITTDNASTHPLGTGVEFTHSGASTVVASLPTASTNLGNLYVVSNSTGTASPCVGGGSTQAIAQSNGTQWNCTAATSLIAPIGNIVDDIQFQGISGNGLGRAIHFSVRNSNDANNDQSKISIVGNNYSTACVEIEGTQSKRHNLNHMRCTSSSASTTSSSVELLNGSFIAYDFWGGCTSLSGGESVFNIQGLSDRVGVYGFDSEGCGHLLTSATGGSTAGQHVSLSSGRYATNGIAANCKIVDFQRNGPLTLDNIYYTGAGANGCTQPIISFAPGSNATHDGHLTVTNQNFALGMVAGSNTWDEISLGQFATLTSHGNRCDEGTGGANPGASLPCIGNAAGVQRFDGPLLNLGQELLTVTVPESTSTRYGWYSTSNTFSLPEQDDITCWAYNSDCSGAAQDAGWYTWKDQVEQNWSPFSNIISLTTPITVSGSWDNTTGSHLVSGVVGLPTSAWKNFNILVDGEPIQVKTIDSTHLNLLVRGNTGITVASVTTTGGSGVIPIGDTSHLFVGESASGTNIPAASTIQSIVQNVSVTINNGGSVTGGTAAVNFGAAATHSNGATVNFLDRRIERNIDFANPDGTSFRHWADQFSSYLGQAGTFADWQVNMVPTSMDATPGFDLKWAPIDSQQEMALGASGTANNNARLGVFTTNVGASSAGQGSLRAEMKVAFATTQNFDNYAIKGRAVRNDTVASLTQNDLRGGWFVAETNSGVAGTVQGGNLEAMKAEVNILPAGGTGVLGNVYAMHGAINFTTASGYGTGNGNLTMIQLDDPGTWPGGLFNWQASTGIDVPNMHAYGRFHSFADALTIESQNCTSGACTTGDNGNLRLVGGSQTTGGLWFGAYSGANGVQIFNNAGVLSTAKGSAQTSGRAIVAGSAVATYGPTAWGDGATVTTGTTACSNLGLTCSGNTAPVFVQTGTSPVVVTAVACGTANAAPFLVECK